MLYWKRLKDISTPDFSTPSFNRGPFNPILFNPELFKPMVKKFNVEKFMVEKFMVEKPGVERSGVEACGWKVRGWDVLQPKHCMRWRHNDFVGKEFTKIYKQIFLKTPQPQKNPNLCRIPMSVAQLGNVQWPPSRLESAAPSTSGTVRERATNI